MICPAILDPFQGANYRLVAATHQALLCPIIAKFFGYIFTPSSNTLDKDMTTRNDSSCQVQHVNHSIFDGKDMESSHIHHKTNTKSHNECNTTRANGKQFENGCDISNNGHDSIQSPNDSNKKIQ